MFGFASNLRCRQYARYSANWFGQPWQRDGMELLCFFSMMSLYFLDADLALRPCQGRPPLRKYMSTYPMDSRSSRRDCSTPRWLLMLAYLGVPVRLLPSLCGMCCSVLGCLYLLLSPKSMQYTLFVTLPGGCWLGPGHSVTKFAGLMSRWIRCRECISSTRSSIWSASMQTVFREKRRLHLLNWSSREGPRRSGGWWWVGERGQSWRAKKWKLRRSEEVVLAMRRLM